MRIRAMQQGPPVRFNAIKSMAAEIGCSPHDIIAWCKANKPNHHPPSPTSEAPPLQLTAAHASPPTSTSAVSAGGQAAIIAAQGANTTQREADNAEEVSSEPESEDDESVIVHQLDTDHLMNHGPMPAEHEDVGKVSDCYL